ncbi:3-oxoacyl-[acyl-carrier protein] reductase [Rhodococcus wratislaviensis]|uniref:3-oxoacyl-[acyl-carrier-protein] reductase MabA n=1 Tax=Rhodococcus wratislaviensis TaxID=44752 RepID=A0AB38FD47_RHOWR|nr:SDR family NAD(P)-dependent oxidoreductase [Rhodococcus wratislaviensis]REE75458.1 3-oxoacyl-[acyl-carrier protein] reductase [Rhodococcus wratislaviensis]SPZ39508.1 3-oxoacyl-ACP reductase [Rhodococcus wratislaviensis]
MMPRNDEPYLGGRLVGPSVVIAGSGAGNGLGRSLALGFAQAGADLTLNYFREDAAAFNGLLAELRGLGARVTAIEGDISVEPTAEELAASALREFGRIDVLVNNAAISTPTYTHEMSLQTWQRTIDVNLTGTFLTTRAVLPTMIGRRRGRIINISSQIALKGGREHGHYAAAKAGMIAFTKSVALEVGAYGITANCIAPGPLDTRLMTNVSDQWKQDKLRELVIPRFGTPDEVIPTALLLASDPAGNLYTGQTLGPNSGDVMP